MGALFLGGTGGLLSPAELLPLQTGIGPGHAALDVTGHRVVQGVGQVLPAAGYLTRLPQAALQLEQGGPGAEKVQAQQDEDGEQDPFTHRTGQKAGEGDQKGVEEEDAQQGQQAPDQGVFQADMSVEIPWFLRIVPPLLVGDALQQQSGDQLQAGGQDHAAQKQKEGGERSSGGKMAKRTAGQIHRPGRRGR